MRGEANKGDATPEGEDTGATEADESEKKGEGSDRKKSGCRPLPEGPPIHREVIFQGDDPYTLVTPDTKARSRGGTATPPGSPPPHVGML